MRTSPAFSNRITSKTDETYPKLRLYVLFAGQITAGGSGTVAVTGTGGSVPGNNNYGVYVSGANAQITSSGGAVTVTGTGTNGADDIRMESGGKITSTPATAGITLNSTTHGAAPNTNVEDVSTDAAKTTTFGTGSKLNIVINGLTPHTQYQQLGVVGMIDLNNAELTFVGSTHTPTIGETFLIVDNNHVDAVIGTFNGLAEGAFIPNFLGSGLSAQITYLGGDGNDVMLTVISTCSISRAIIWHEDMVSGVKDAVVNLSGSAVGSATTDVNGDYTISFTCVNGTGVVTPVKNINPLNGVNVADVLAIQQHAVSAVLITNAFKQIAADVNQNNLISSQNAAILSQAIKGNPTALAILSNSPGGLLTPIGRRSHPRGDSPKA